MKSECRRLKSSWGRCLPAWRHGWTSRGRERRGSGSAPASGRDHPTLGRSPLRRSDEGRRTSARRLGDLVGDGRPGPGERSARLGGMHEALDGDGRGRNVRNVARGEEAEAFGARAIVLSRAGCGLVRAMRMGGGAAPEGLAVRTAVGLAVRKVLRKAVRSRVRRAARVVGAVRVVQRSHGRRGDRDARERERRDSLQTGPSRASQDETTLRQGGADGREGGRRSGWTSTA